MKHMLNILIITVMALVVIAAGVQLCRPKDHGECLSYDEEYVGPSITKEDKNGLIISIRLTPLMSAFYRNLEEINGKERHSVGYSQYKKHPWVEYKEDKYGNPVRITTDEELRRQMFDHLTEEFNHKPKL